MPSDPVQAVLRDFENLVWLALILGLVLFAGWRFFFPGARESRSSDGRQPASDNPAGGLAPLPRALGPAPGVASGAFTWADLVLLPLVLIKYSVTLQLLAASTADWPDRIAGLFGQELGTKAPVSSPPPGSAQVDLSALAIVLDMALSIMLVCLVFVVIQWVGRRDAGKLFGFGRLKPAWLALWVLAGASIATPAILVLSFSLPEVLQPVFGDNIEEQAAVENIRRTADTAFRVLLIFNAVLIAPFVEEVVFRGFFYGALKQYTSPLFAAFISAALFSVAHQNLLALLPLWGLALLLTFFYEASRCLWVPVGVHAIFNAANVALILLGFGGEGAG